MGQPQDATATFKEHIKSQTHIPPQPPTHIHIYRAKEKDKGNTFTDENLFAAKHTVTFYFKSRLYTIFPKRKTFSQKLSSFYTKVERLHSIYPIPDIVSPHLIHRNCYQASPIIPSPNNQLK